MKRRDFLKDAAIGAGALALAGCSSGTVRERKTDGAGSDAEDSTAANSSQMEIRVNPANGDRVSLLGFGCMRWPMIKGPLGTDVIDQETVNALVDQAMAGGVNYYDTSPVYLQGQSEAAAGIALSRYPRDSYYLATKLSNFSNHGRAASIRMYQNSFKALRTD